MKGNNMKKYIVVLEHDKCIRILAHSYRMENGAYYFRDDNGYVVAKFEGIQGIIDADESKMLIL